jgi:hypothetical protein
VKLVVVERVGTGTTNEAEDPLERASFATERRSTPDLAVDLRTHSSSSTLLTNLLNVEGSGMRLSFRRFTSIDSAIAFLKVRYGDLLAGCSAENPITVNATVSFPGLFCVSYLRHNPRLPAH